MSLPCSSLGDVNGIRQIKTPKRNKQAHMPTSKRSCRLARTHGHRPFATGRPSFLKIALRCHSIATGETSRHCSSELAFARLDIFFLTGTLPCRRTVSTCLHSCGRFVTTSLIGMESEPRPRFVYLIASEKFLKYDFLRLSKTERRRISVRFCQDTRQWSREHDAGYRA